MAKRRRIDSDLNLSGDPAHDTDATARPFERLPPPVVVDDIFSFLELSVTFVPGYTSQAAAESAKKERRARSHYGEDSSPTTADVVIAFMLSLREMASAFEPDYCWQSRNLRVLGDPPKKFQHQIEIASSVVLHGYFQSDPFRSPWFFFRRLRMPLLYMRKSFHFGERLALDPRRVLSLHFEVGCPIRVSRLFFPHCRPNLNERSQLHRISIRGRSGRYLTRAVWAFFLGFVDVPELELRFGFDGRNDLPTLLPTIRGIPEDSRHFRGQVVEETMANWAWSGRSLIIHFGPAAILSSEVPDPPAIPLLRLSADNVRNLELLSLQPSSSIVGDLLGEEDQPILLNPVKLRRLRMDSIRSHYAKTQHFWARRSRSREERFKQTRMNMALYQVITSKLSNLTHLFLTDGCGLIPPDLMPIGETTILLPNLRLLSMICIDIDDILSVFQLPNLEVLEIDDTQDATFHYGKWNLIYKVGKAPTEEEFKAEPDRKWKRKLPDTLRRLKLEGCPLLIGIFLELPNSVRRLNMNVYDLVFANGEDLLRKKMDLRSIEELHVRYSPNVGLRTSCACLSSRNVKHAPLAPRILDLDCQVSDFTMKAMDLSNLEFLRFAARSARACRGWPQMPKLKTLLIQSPTKNSQDCLFDQMAFFAEHGGFSSVKEIEFPRI